VSLPEAPLLAVLPGTGGLTRLVDKRKVRRDLADVFSTLAEGIKGKRAVEWRLVDEVAPQPLRRSTVKARARRQARRARPASRKGPGFHLPPRSSPRRRTRTAARYYTLRHGVGRRRARTPRSP
jgi:benzoyl-CoA-dihydrodiol lyase